MNADAWKKHFVDMASGKFRTKSFYRLGVQRGGSDENPIRLVTPTQQAIEMARSEEKRTKLKRTPIKRKQSPRTPIKRKQSPVKSQMKKRRASVNIKKTVTKKKHESGRTQ